MEDTCRTCGASYDTGGDGFDGECPSCADKTAERESKGNDDLSDDAQEILDWFETEDGQETLRLTGGFVTFLGPRSGKTCYAAAGSFYFGSDDEGIAEWHSSIGELVDNATEVIHDAERIASLALPSERWRALPPTEAQLRVLDRWARIRGERHPQYPATRGECSDHISAVVKHAKERAAADEFDPPNEDANDFPARDWGDL